METNEIVINTNLKKCKKHNIVYIECSFEGCTDKEVCRDCALLSKEGVEHLFNHYENLKEKLCNLITISETDNDLPPFKDDEVYADLNKVYIDCFDKVDCEINSMFSSINEKKSIIKGQLKSSISEKYFNITEEFEALVKKVTEKINNLSISDSKSKSEVKKIKKELDDQLTFINSSEEINKNFEKCLNKFSEKFKKLNVDNLLKGNFDFSVNIALENSNWETDSPSFCVNPRGSSYWCIRSKEVLEGPFTCKVLIKNIDSQSVGSYWNYTFGIIKESMVNESSYYNDCVLIQSNGYCPTQFSGSGSGTSLFNDVWKIGDTLLLKRDDAGNIYFGINNESSYKMGFPNITGRFRIVMGFSTSMTKGEFEIIELIKQ